MAFAVWQKKAPPERGGASQREELRGVIARKMMGPSRVGGAP